MAQNSNEHLPITQISAYVDKELAPNELAICDAHLATCEECRALLAELRLTSVLTRQLPQVEVPRSFVLPLNIAVLPETSESEPIRHHQVKRNVSSARWRNLIRPLSTIAAVLGMFLLVVGLCGAIPLNRGGSATSSMPMVGNSAGQSPQSPQYAGGTALNGHASPGVKSSPEYTTPVVTQATPSTDSNQERDTSQTSAGGVTLPAVLDPGQIGGRLFIGALLFVLGLLGLFFSRHHVKQRR